MADNTPHKVALEKMQQTMYAVEVDQAASRRAEKKLAKVLPSKWHGNTTVRKHFGITDFVVCAAGIRENLGIPEKQYKEILFTHQFTEAGESSKLEVDYDDGKLETNYVFFAMYKHPGGGGTDVVYALYKMTAEAPPKTRVQVGHVTSGWWLWKKVKPIFEERTEPGGLEKLQRDEDYMAFARCKAMAGFADEGVLDRKKLKIIEIPTREETMYDAEEERTARPPRNRALEKIQQKMYLVPLDRDAADRAEKKLEEVLPNKWHDRTPVREDYDIKDFTAYMSDTREKLHIPEEHYDDILVSYKHAQSGQTSLIEVDFQGDVLETNYMIFALHKHPDGGGTDLVYLMYELKAEAKTATRKVKSGGRKSDMLWWKKITPKYGLATFKQDKDAKAFYRCKAMEGSTDEGVLHLAKLNVI